MVRRCGAARATTRGHPVGVTPPLVRCGVSFPGVVGDGGVGVTWASRLQLRANAAVRCQGLLVEKGAGRWLVEMIGSGVVM